MKRLSVSGRQNTVFEINGYVETAIEHPMYSATLTLMHEITFSVFF